MTAILIIDHDQAFCDEFCAFFRNNGYKPTQATSLADGHHFLQNTGAELVLMNGNMPDGHSLSLLSQIRKMADAPEVVIMSTDFDPEQVRQAIENGAWDYIGKPFSFAKVKTIIESVFRYRKQKPSVTPRKMFDRGGIIGGSVPLEDNLGLASQAAESDVSVLIFGETGTGKELFAKVIHQNSNRSDRQMVTVDCAALPEDLAESILFGHVRGAFTGADTNRDGLVKQADGGTLFLDEIGELSLNLQKVFLRVLQEKKFRPVGGKSETKSDFRLISATNRDLAHMAGEGRFREDLLFRIQSMVIQPPPLRERKQDISEIIHHYIGQWCTIKGDAHKEISPDFLEALQLYSWPGNIRELINVVDNCLARSQGEAMLFPRHLPVQLRVQVAQSIDRRRKSVTEPGLSDQDWPAQRETLPDLKSYRQAAAQEAEKVYLQKLVNLPQVTIDEACRIGGISRSRFYELLKKHQVPTLKIKELLTNYI